MIQASSGSFLHVLLKIQITEQFRAFEDSEWAQRARGLLGAGSGCAADGDNAEPPEPGASSDGGTGGIGSACR